MNTRAISAFERWAQQAQSELDKFAKSFAESPSNALMWGTGAFESAARLDVAKSLIWSFTPRVDWAPITVDQAISIVTDQLMNAARYPAHSTSPTSNLLAQYRISALTEALDKLKSLNSRD
jgi:hypothetical protein